MSNTQMAHELTEEQSKLRIMVTTQLETMETKTEKLQKAILRLETNKANLEAEIAALKRENEELVQGLQREQNLNQELSEMVGRLHQSKVEAVQGLDLAISILNKRRRIMADSMHSPMSPDRSNISDDDTD